MLTASYQFFHFNSDQSLLNTTPKYRSKSFVQNFLNALSENIGGSPTTFVDVDGNTLSLPQPTSGFYPTLSALAIGGDLTTAFQENVPDGSIDTYSQEKFGIVLGTGTIPVTTSDRYLATPIVHGSSSGKLEYLPCSGRNFTINSGTQQATFDIERLFRNSSGGTITIYELGLCTSIGGTYFYSVMIIRDVLGAPQTVNDGEYLKTIYTIQITS